MSYFVSNNTDSAKARYDKAIEMDPRYDGNFGALTSDVIFNERQLRTLNSLYSTLYTGEVIEEGKSLLFFLTLAHLLH
jgi:hypothetical protein